MTLIDELNGEKGSFLSKLRNNLDWNHNSFLNLIYELKKECTKSKNQTLLNREMSFGVWYISGFIKDWSQHKAFPKIFPKEYYEKAYDLINDLAYEYFMAESIYQSESEIENKIEELKTICQHHI